MQQSAGLPHILKEKWGCSEGLVNLFLILPACWSFAFKVVSPSGSTKPDMEKGDGGLVVQDEGELQLCDEGQHSFCSCDSWLMSHSATVTAALVFSESRRSTGTSGTPTCPKSTRTRAAATGSCSWIQRPLTQVKTEVQKHPSGLVCEDKRVRC